MVSTIGLMLLICHQVASLSNVHEDAAIRHGEKLTGIVVVDTISSDDRERIEGLASVLKQLRDTDYEAYSRLLEIFYREFHPRAERTAWDYELLKDGLGREAFDPELSGSFLVFTMFVLTLSYSASYVEHLPDAERGSIRHEHAEFLLSVWSQLYEYTRPGLALERAARAPSILDLAQELGRPPPPVWISGMSPDGIPDLVLREAYRERLEAHGAEMESRPQVVGARRTFEATLHPVQSFILRLYGADPETREELETLLERYMPDQQLRATLLAEVEKEFARHETWRELGIDPYSGADEAGEAMDSEPDANGD